MEMFTLNQAAAAMVVILMLTEIDLMHNINLNILYQTYHKEWLLNRAGSLPIQR